MKTFSHQLTYSYGRILIPLDNSLTPEQKLEQALTASRAAKSKPVTGLPSYVNPAVINPVHFKAVQEKRKLLWGKGKDKQVSLL